jgi:AcrR family transcriptional regulator
MWRSLAFVDHVIGETELYHLIDQMIDETAARSVGRRITRAEQRAATRQAIIDATIDCLVQDGYAALTTRRVAERAGVAQSTVMHHFETREALLVEAVIHVALGLAEQSLSRIDFAALRTPEHREAVLDEAWREFTSPQALAAAQLWAAVWNEPELTPVLRELEGRLTQILVGTAGALFPELANDSRLPALLDAAVSLIRGLVLAIPVWGEEAVTARWQAIKPFMLDATAQILGEDVG